jgi:hypothetical protein
MAQPTIFGYVHHRQRGQKAVQIYRLYPGTRTKPAHAKLTGRIIFRLRHING